MAFAGVCWCLLLSDGVCLCPMVSGDVKRVSEEFFKAYLSAVYGCVYGFVAFEGVYECSALYGALHFLNIHGHPSIKSVMGQHSQFLRRFGMKLEVCK